MRYPEVAAAFAYTPEPKSVEASRVGLEQELPDVVNLKQHKALAKAAQVEKGPKKKRQGGRKVHDQETQAKEP